MQKSDKRIVHKESFFCNFHKRNNNPQNFLTLIFNNFLLSCNTSRSYLVTVLNYLTSTTTTPQKIVFVVKSLWNWSCHNFSYWNASVSKLWRQRYYIQKQGALRNYFGLKMISKLTLQNLLCLQSQQKCEIEI